MSILLAAAMAVVTTIPTIDQDQLQGSFEARLDRSPYINLSVTTEGNGHSNWGQSVDPGEVTDLRVGDGRVSFQIKRAAGTFRMEGKGTEAKVRGTFDFFPSEPFRKQLTALGFNGVTSEHMLVFAIGGLSIADVKYIEEITTDDLTTARLVKMIEHSVDADFVKGMADVGFRRLRSSELINARDHGVTPVYIASMQKFGYRLSLAEYVLAKDQGIDFRRQALGRNARRT
jgi:hypothetical protein